MPTSNFRKVRPGAGAMYYAAEAAGLEWLRVPAGPPIPEVISIGQAALEMERITESSPSREAAEAFGAALATMHSSGAEGFGVGPPTAPGSGWIADVPMPYGTFDSFGPMYAELRIRPYLKLAREAEAFSAQEFAVFEQLCDRLLAEDPQLVGPAEVPARIHGDLWSGNLMWAPDRDGKPAVWLVDPAAYGGHRETDIAMLALFGAPQFDRIVGAYCEANPLAEGWRSRIPLHQVYPLLVHTVLFGGGYSGQAVMAAHHALGIPNPLSS